MTEDAWKNQMTNGTYTSSKIGLTRGSDSNILLISEGDVGIASPLLFLRIFDEDEYGSGEKVQDT